MRTLRSRETRCEVSLLVSSQPRSLLPCVTSHLKGSEDSVEAGKQGSESEVPWYVWEAGDGCIELSIAAGHCSRDPAVLSLMLGGVQGEKQKDQEWGSVQSQKAGRAGRAEGSAEGRRCEVQGESRLSPWGRRTVTKNRGILHELPMSRNGDSRSLASSSEALNSWQEMGLTFLTHACIPCEARSSAATRCCIPWAGLQFSSLPAFSSPAPVKQDHRSRAVRSGIAPGAPPPPLENHSDSTWAWKHLLNEQMTNTFVSRASYSSSVQQCSSSSRRGQAVHGGLRQSSWEKGNHAAAQAVLMDSKLGQNLKRLPDKALSSLFWAWHL
ncbi:uncharacterized protein LOC123388856 isoform X2 [Mustela putorius furo]|nr:uncharacterized protein LOC123388856 isoform X2 [Mustela putorius furo]XP_044925145.1 uncharacterized protein LOC123388856 isoform X2 [Mustela putorius furo]XP_044925146.1 uncharacterized protein LOC123388856 isoform X2 [Mustela putorius furo]